MKGLWLAALVSMLAGVAHGADVAADWTKQEARIIYFDHQAFYSCHYVERRAEDILHKLGARDVDLRCRGGLPYEDTVYLTAKFETLMPAAEGAVKAAPQTVVLRVQESCDLNETLIRELSKKFNVIEHKVQGSCWHSEGRQTHTITVLR